MKVSGQPVAEIPEAVLTQHFVTLGKTRSGKSSTMRLLVERLLDLNKPVCIIDPKGDWWGLKSSADGKRAGYPVMIFGGEHADWPLNEHAGAAVAELLATGNRTAIIDLGGWMVGERTRFFIKFASTFFRLIRGPHWLAIDEVHNFAPKARCSTPMRARCCIGPTALPAKGPVGASR
jgi:DNA helicase HerA-like ATPase